MMRGTTFFVSIVFAVMLSGIVSGGIDPRRIKERATYTTTTLPWTTWKTKGPKTINPYDTTINPYDSTINPYDTTTSPYDTTTNPSGKPWTTNPTRRPSTTNPNQQGGQIIQAECTDHVNCGDYFVWAPYSAICNDPEAMMQCRRACGKCHLFRQGTTIPTTSPTTTTTTTTTTPPPSTRPPTTTTTTTPPPPTTLSPTVLRDTPWCEHMCPDRPFCDVPRYKCEPSGIYYDVCQQTCLDMYGIPFNPYPLPTGPFYHIRHDRSNTYLEVHPHNAIDIRLRALNVEAPQQQWFWDGDYLRNRMFYKRVLAFNNWDFCDNWRNDAGGIGKVVLHYHVHGGTSLKWRYEDGFIKNLWTDLPRIRDIRMTPYSEGLWARRYLSNGGVKSKIGGKGYSEGYSTFKWTLIQV